MRGRDWWDQISKFINVGAVFDSLRCADVPNFEFRIPPLPEQRAVAKILGTLDDKIELNRRMNETLEAMARALFKSWFVDFDPVRAKADGCHPTTPKPLAELFPSRFVDSELGEIPEGWGVAPFADTIEIVGGGTPKTSVGEYWDGDIPWFSVVDAPSGSEIWVVEYGKESHPRRCPELIHSCASRGHDDHLCTGDGWANRAGWCTHGDESVVLRAQGRMGADGFFNYFSTRELVERLQQHAHGSVFDTITRDTLAGVSVVEPPAELIEAFEKRVGPSLERIRAGLLETRTLATLRDRLLPKLISGELRVKGRGEVHHEVRA